MKTSHLAPRAISGGALLRKPLANMNAFRHRLGVRFGNVVTLFAISACFASTASAAAPAITLAWNANSESDISGYQLRYGTGSGVYTNVINVGVDPTTAVSGLTEGSTYYFVVSAINSKGLKSAASGEVSYTVPRAIVTPAHGWTLKSVDSQEAAGYAGECAFDGDPETFWHTQWTGVSSLPLPPHEIQIDMGAVKTLAGFTYLPRQGSWTVGNIGQYEFFVSLDGVAWGTPVATGTFANTSVLKEVSFASKSGRFIRLRELTAANGGSECAVAELNVIESTHLVNQAPVAATKALSTGEDTAVAVTLTGTDADANPLTFSVVTAPAHGTLSGTAPNLSYSPAADYNGSDSFTYVANDGTVNSSAATVSITVTPVNDPPVALAKSVTTSRDTALPVVLAATDKDADSLTFSVVAGPAHGVLSGTPPNLTYTPTASYTGADQFTFRANDSVANSAITTVSIAVTAVNEVPVAVAKSVTTTEDTPLAIALTGTDANSDPLTFTVLTNPTKGTLTGTAPNLTYSPTADANGSDSFTFRVNDGTVNSATATVSISVTPVNDAPLAVAKSITTAEDTPVSIVLAGTDKDLDSLIYSVVANPAHGTLSGTAPNLIYTPAGNYNGADQFTFSVNDGTAISAAATVAITVSPVNDAPLAVSKPVTTGQDTPLAITVTATDVDATSLAFAVVTGPTKGTLSGTAPNLTYLPAAGFYGSDQFTFRANDGTTTSALATVSITVTKRPPVAGTSVIPRTGWILKYVDSQEIFDGLATFAFDGDPATKWHSQWRSGTPSPTPHEIQINLGAVQNVTGFQYLPRQDGYSVGNIGAYEFYVSLDGVNWGSPVAVGTFANSPVEKQIIFTARSGQFIRFRAMTEVNGNTDTSVAELNILQGNLTNQLPVASSQSLTSEEDTPLPILLGGSDSDGSALSYSIVSAPLNGTLTGTAPSLTYLPNPDFKGVDQFTFRVNDGAEYSPVATVSLTVTGVVDVPGNTPPAFAANLIAFPATEDQAFTGQLVASDADPVDTLTFRKISGPSWLWVSADGELGGTPLNSDVGINSFTIKVSDPSNASATAILNITVSNTNDAPVFKINPMIYPAGTEKMAYRDQSLASTAADPDIDDTFTYSKVAGPEWLTIAKSGTLGGTPPSASAGTNLFTIRATDAKGAFTDTTLQIKINTNTLPLPWSLYRVGTGNAAGGARYSAGTYTLAGAGVLAETEDAGNFGWQTLASDGEISARVSSLDDTGAATRVGLMVRESLAGKARQVFIGVDGNAKYHFLSRAKTGGTAVRSTLKADSGKAVWLRLVRKDNTITAYKSNNGTVWTKVAKATLTLPKNCYVGLSVSSGDKEELNTSKFSNVRVTK